MPTTPSRRDDRAFSLVELLVVISIISILLAILFPVVGAVQNGARKAATTSLMSNILTATSQFVADNQRLPGVFSQEDLGRTENIDAGFTPMENALLELAGGLVQDPNASSDFTRVGPFTDADRRRAVDIGRIGASDGPQYLTLGQDNLLYDSPADGRSMQQAIPEHVDFPDVIDSFGNPILMWQENPFAGATPVFAEDDADDATERARFYWAANASMLESRTLGRRLEKDNLRNSMLTTFSPNSPESRARTLAGVLGDPAFPRGNVSPPEPSRALGPVILHSPGRDGFFAENDFRRFERVVYVPTSGAVEESDFSDNDLTVDILDDIIQGGGG